MRILFRSIRMRRDKWLLMVCSLSIGVSVAVAMSNMTLDLERKMNRELRAYGPNLLIRPAGGEGGTLPEGIFEQVKTRAGENLHAGAPFLYRLGEVNRKKAVLVGSDIGSLALLYPSWKLHSGTGLDALKPDDCLVGKKLADRFPIQPGNTVAVSYRNRTKNFRVADILITGDIEEGQLFLPFKSLQDLTGDRQRISVAALSLLGTFQEIDRWAQNLGELLPGTEVKLIRKVAVAEGEVLRKLKLMMALSAAVLLLITGLSIGTTLSAVIRERREEIALFKAIGFTDGRITRLFLTESLFLGIAGGLLGYAIGIVMSEVLGEFLFGSLVRPRWPLLPAALLLAVVTSLAAFAAPVRRTLAVDPATVLAGR